MMTCPHYTQLHLELDRAEQDMVKLEEDITEMKSALDKKLYRFGSIRQSIVNLRHQVEELKEDK